MNPRALVLAVACLLPATRAAAQPAPSPSPCDDVNYASQFKVQYPTEVNRVYTDEQTQRAAWNARAETISRQMVASRSRTQDAQSTFRYNLSKRPDIAALDGQIAQASEEFRERNIALQAAPLMSPLDPARPYRAWCLLATKALDAVKAKLAIETRQWQLVDQALLADAASKGQQFASPSP